MVARHLGPWHLVAVHAVHGRSRSVRTRASAVSPATLAVVCVLATWGLNAIGCDSSVHHEARGNGETSQAAFCAKSCETAADCCPEDAPAGAPACPGAYPRNWGCDEGLCVPPRCEADADCTIPGRTSCRLLGGLASCVHDCSADADCDEGDVSAGGLGSASVCSQAADDGTPFCGPPSPLCDDDTDCLAPGSHCLDGERCGCRDDDDCAERPFKTCRGGACSCASDDECGPALDVCTTDRTFSSPPSAQAKPGGSGPP